MATTTTVVYTFFYLGGMHGVDELDVPPALVVILEAPPTPPLDPWDVPLSPLPDIEMEPMSLVLPSLEILPLPIVPVVKLSSNVTPVMMVVSPLYLKYHPGVTLTYKEDPSEESSTTASHTPHIAKPSHALRVEVLRKEPHIIHTPFVP